MPSSAKVRKALYYRISLPFEWGPLALWFTKLMRPLVLRVLIDTDLCLSQNRPAPVIKSFYKS